MKTSYSWAFTPYDRALLILVLPLSLYWLLYPTLEHNLPLSAATYLPWPHLMALEITFRGEKIQKEKGKK